MNRFISVVLVTSMALSGTPANAADGDADEAPLMDPSKHIRIVYNKFNTPDSMVFKALLSRIQFFDETTFLERSWRTGFIKK